MCIRDRINLSNASLSEPDMLGRAYEYLIEHFADDAGKKGCLLYTSDAADERSSVDLGGRRIIKKKNSSHYHERAMRYIKKKQTQTTRQCMTR